VGYRPQRALCQQEQDVQHESPKLSKILCRTDHPSVFSTQSTRHVHLVAFNMFPIKTLRIFTAIILVTWSLNHSLPNFSILKILVPIPVAAWSAATRLLTLWVRIPPGAWMCVCCVLSGRGLCDELITRPESYRLWCFIACDLEASWMRRPWPSGGWCKKNGSFIHKIPLFYSLPSFLTYFILLSYRYFPGALLSSTCNG